MAQQQDAQYTDQRASAGAGTPGRGVSQEPANGPGAESISSQTEAARAAKAKKVGEANGGTARVRGSSSEGSKAQTTRRDPEGPLRTRSVKNFVGEITEAIDQDVVPKPPLTDMNGWRKWRGGPGLRPTVRANPAANGGRDTTDFTTPKEEADMWRAAMAHCYGEHWVALR